MRREWWRVAGGIRRCICGDDAMTGREMSGKEDELDFFGVEAREERKECERSEDAERKAVSRCNGSRGRRTTLCSS